MTIPEIKKLCELTKDLSTETMLYIYRDLPFFDATNYVVWMQELYNITIPV